MFEHYSSKKDGLSDDGMANVEVSFDGSWHKRGYKSNFGVGAVIDVDLGLVLDYHICSKLCSLCTNKNTLLRNKKLTETDYVMWWEDEHWMDCEENYEGASGGMESNAAVEMWSRSRSMKMMYRTFLSDGDSSAYKSICEMNGNNGVYGDQYKVEKAECVNHVAKRLGTALRDKKKTVGKMGGKNKLTDLVINHLQFYYQVSLKRKLHTNTKEMRDEILSSFYHCTTTDARPQHQLCTQGEKSWCFYNRALAHGETPASHTHMLVSFHLADEELKHVKDVYERLTRDDLLKKCLAGLTQNRNEHLHSRIWRICPKHRNASPRMIRFATATAIANYNAGYIGSNINHLLGVELTTSMEAYLQQKDETMDSPIRRKRRNKMIRKGLEEYASGRF